jgi:superfamily II DNA/RNA helicase
MIANVELKEHQNNAVDKALDVSKFMLIAKPGLGKTLIAMVTAIKKYEQDKIKKILWVTPPNLINNLNNELKKFINYRYHSLFNFISQNQINRHINKHNDFMLIIDECHNFKNTNTAKRSEIIFELSNKAKQLLIMTGTPKGVNRNADLFYAYKMLIDNQANYKFYLREFTIRDKGKIIDSKNTEILLKLFEPFSIWIDKTSLNLPPKHHRVINVRVNDEMKELITNVALYNVFKYKNNNYIKISFTSLALNSGRLLAKKNGNLESIDLVTNKNATLKQLIETIEGQVIIYYFFKFELDMITELLDTYNYTYTVRHGELNDRHKSIAIDDFTNNRVRFLVASIQSSNMGLTLINANNIIYYNTSFSPTELEQSQDRIHRIGQTKDCNYYYLANGVINNYIIQSQLDLIDQADKMFKFGGDIESFDYNSLVKRIATKTEESGELIERINIINELEEENKKDKNIPILFKFNDIRKKGSGYYIEKVSGLYKPLKSIKKELLWNDPRFSNYIKLVKNDKDVVEEIDVLSNNISSLVNNDSKSLIEFDYTQSIIKFFEENDCIDVVINHQHIGDETIGYGDTIPLLAYDVNNELCFFDFILYNINSIVVENMRKRNVLRNEIIMNRAKMKINKSYLIEFTKNNEYILKNIAF